MLPFLKPKTIAGLIISKRKPDGGTEEKTSEGNEDAGLDSCSEALIRAIHAKDAKSVSSALKNAFEILNDSEDSEKSPESESPHTYANQNALAAKGQ